MLLVEGKVQDKGGVMLAIRGSNPEPKLGMSAMPLMQQCGPVPSPERPLDLLRLDADAQRLNLRSAALCASVIPIR